MRRSSHHVFGMPFFHLPVGYEAFLYGIQMGVAHLGVVPPRQTLIEWGARTAVVLLAQAVTRYSSYFSAVDGIRALIAVSMTSSVAGASRGRLLQGLILGLYATTPVDGLILMKDSECASDIRASVDRESGVESAIRRQLPATVAPRTLGRTPLCCGTANVNTLKPREEALASAKVNGALLLGKTQILESRFRRHGLDVVFVQEGRARSKTNRSGSSYDMYIGSADDGGNYGTQVWIRSGLGFVLSSFLQRSPRIVTVAGSVDGGTTPLALISAHAPTLSAPQGEKDTFWRQLTEVYLEMCTKHSSDNVFLGIDANARPPPDGVRVGEFDPEKSNDNGILFSSFLNAVDASAVNTFHRCGYTWRCPRGTTARIDYLVVPTRHLSRVSGCDVPDSLDLSISSFEDHRVVRMWTYAEEDIGADVPEVKRPPLNKAALSDPGRVAGFKDALAEYVPLCSYDISARVEHASSFIFDAAESSLGPRVAGPRKPWISSETWAVLKPQRRLRQAAFTARREVKTVWLQLVFVGWISVHKERLPLDGHGLVDVGASPTYSEFRRAWMLRCRRAAKLWSGVCDRAFSVAKRIAADRLAFLEAKAEEASSSARHRDWKTSYAIVRSLGGKKSMSAPPQMRKLDGSLTESATERDNRWVEHFTGVFGGHAATFDVIAAEPVGPPVSYSPVRADFNVTSAAFSRLRNNKGVGSDGIPGEVLRAGGDNAVSIAAPLFDDVITSEVWPVQWTGGRLAEVHKAKGPADECDEYRGVVLENHLSKALKIVLAPFVNSAVYANMPGEQHGAMPGKGTDLATHLVLSFLQLCIMRQLCVFAIFIDLTKAFDRAVREIAMGFPSGCSDPSDHLRSLGLNERQVAWIVEWLSVHGSQFERWGMSPKVLALVKNLHSRSWFSYGSVDSAIRIRKGGRQGCVFGSTVFNTPFALAIQIIIERLDSVAAVLSLDVVHGTFWGGGASADAAGEACEHKESVHVAFVDDGVFYVAARTCALLDKLVDSLLGVISDVYSLLALDINFKPRKTEALLQYRGSGTAAAYAARRRPDGSLGVAVPGSDQVIRVVGEYAHLGTIVSARGAERNDAVKKRTNASQAYFPIASKVYGARAIPIALRSSFMWTLVLSRLLYNVHIVVPSIPYLRVLGGLYMRVIRKIHGAERYGPSVTDAELRDQCRAPSIDCIVARARLRYLRRVLCGDHAALRTMLGQRAHGKRLPWVDLVVDDMRRLGQLVARCGHLGDPDVCVDAWVGYISASAERWRCDVNMLHFTSSVLDRQAVGDVEVARPFSCPHCDYAAATARQLGSHVRIKHGHRATQRQFAPASGVCPVCATTFSTRLQLLAHLCESRPNRMGARCWQSIIAAPGKYRPLPAKVVEKLDGLDRDARKASWKAGRSHALTIAPAITSGGRAVGRCTR